MATRHVVTQATLGDKAGVRGHAAQMSPLFVLMTPRFCATPHFCPSPSPVPVP